MRKRYRRLAMLLLLTFVTLTPGASPANHGTTDPTMVRGHVTDPYGDPVAVCVNAESVPGAKVFTVAVPSERGAISGPDGSYSFDAASGGTRYHLWTSDHPEFSSGGNWCPYRNWSSDFQQYTSTERDVDTVDENGTSTDLTVKYQLGGGVWGPLCCIESAGKPGDEMDVYARVLKRGADHGMHVIWRDETSGETIDLPRIPNFWQERLSPPYAGYLGTYPIPLDRPDGVYRTSYSVEDPAHPGLEVASGGFFDTIVDSIPPEITTTFPADGDTVPTSLYLFMTGTDSGSGAVHYWSKIRVYDMASGEPVLVAPDDVYDPVGKVAGVIRSPKYLLDDDNPYRAVFTLSDNAGNLSSRTVEFRTGPRAYFTGIEPMGDVTAPDAQIAAVLDTALIPSTARIYVYRMEDQLLSRFAFTQHFDPATRRLWLQPGEASASAIGPPPLFDGIYRVDVIADDYGFDEHSISFTFDVHLGDGIATQESTLLRPGELRPASPDGSAAG